MFDIDRYVNNFLNEAKSVYGERLIYVGLQGSYLRGEAHENSDIDIMVVIDGFCVKDMDMYKDILEKIAETHKAFNVMFNHIGLFRLPQNDVLFAAPEINKEMLALRDNFLDNKDVFPWSAHTTFLIDKADVIHEATAVVMNEFKAFEGKVSKLYLYEFWPARHIMTVELK